MASSIRWDSLGQPCRICKADATYRVLIPEGCFCEPDDREQFLCPQHYDKALGGTFPIQDITDGK